MSWNYWKKLWRMRRLLSRNGVPVANAKRWTRRKKMCAAEIMTIPSIESFECITDHENFDELVLNPVILEVAYIQIMLYIAECLLILNIKENKTKKKKKKKKKKQNKQNTISGDFDIRHRDSISIFCNKSVCHLTTSRLYAALPRCNLFPWNKSTVPHILYTPPPPLPTTKKKEEKKKKRLCWTVPFFIFRPLYTCSLEVNDPLFLKTLGGPLSVPSQYQNWYYFEVFDPSQYLSRSSRTNPFNILISLLLYTNQPLILVYT